MNFGFDRVSRDADIQPGQYVQHNVTGRLGRVHSEIEEGAQFVRVLFHGDNRTLPCRTEELELLHG